MTRDTAFLAENMFPKGNPQEVSRVSFRLQLSSFTRKPLDYRLQQAYASGSLQLVKRLHALLALAQDRNVHEVAEMLDLGTQTVRDSRNALLMNGTTSLTYKTPPGHPSKLTKTPRPQLAEWIKARPQDWGSTSGCWHTPMIQNLIARRFGVTDHPHYMATLLHNMGFSSQKAPCVSDHLHEAKRLEWRQIR